MESLMYAFAVLRRIVSVFAVAPAAAALVMFAFAYQFSFYAAARDAYGYIEYLARLQKDTPAGFLTVRECRNKLHHGSDSALPHAVACDGFELRQVSVDAMADQTAAALATTYWVLVLLGLAVNIAVMGPRRFFMMEGRESGREESSSVEHH